MSNLKSIRERLSVTQQALAAGLGCSQGNVSFYERGQSIPPATAQRLIDFAKERGLVLTFDHVYGAAELPDPHVLPAQDAIESAAQSVGEHV